MQLAKRRCILRGAKVEHGESMDTFGVKTDRAEHPRLSAAALLVKRTPGSPPGGKPTNCKYRYCQRLQLVPVHATHGNKITRYDSTRGRRGLPLPAWVQACVAQPRGGAAIDMSIARAQGPTTCHHSPGALSVAPDTLRAVSTMHQLHMTHLARMGVRRHQRV